HASAAVPSPVEVAPVPTGEKPRRQPEVALAVVAVETPHVVAGKCVARRAGLDVEVPEEVAVVDVDRVDAAFAVDPVFVDVHAEDARVAGDGGRRLALVGLRRGTAEAAVAGRESAAGARIEVPDLPPAQSVDGVDGLASRDEHTFGSVDPAHVDGP